MVPSFLARSCHLLLFPQAMTTGRAGVPESCTLEQVLHEEQRGGLCSQQHR